MANNIRLIKVRLVNWGCFSDITFPINGNNVLITGENATGKTTALDGIKYGMIEDTKFNSAMDSSDRGVEKYVHGYLGDVNGTLLRPGDVVSYILMEYYDYTAKKSTVIGHCIESATINHKNIICFYHDNAVIDDFVLMDEGRIVLPFDSMKFRDKLFITCKEKNGDSMYEKDPQKRNLIMTRRLGLRCDAKDLRKRLATIAGFNKESFHKNSSINSFFQRFIYPEKKISCISDIVRIQSDTNSVLAEIDRHKKKLEEINKALAVAIEYKDADTLYRTNMLLKQKQHIAAIQKDIDRLKNEKEINEHKQDILKEKIEAIKKEEARAAEEYQQAKINSGFLSYEEQIQKCENEISSIEDELATLEQEKALVVSLSETLRNELGWFLSETNDNEVIRKLEVILDQDEDMTSVALPLIQSLQQNQKTILEDMRNQANDLRHQLEDVRSERVEITKKLLKLKENNII